ncbi:MAG: transposase [Candidatus Peribacteria bacterium]|nr:transposase [Candidatus Peribacteria bacterium]
MYFSKHRSDFETIIGYIGRYVKRPVIAQSRILDYDGDTITFCYIDKTEKDFFKRIKNITCSDMEFIESLVQHIPNKYFHMIYYYGIFANRVKTEYLNLINSLYPSRRIFRDKGENVWLNQ